MAEKIKLVQGDNLPTILLTLTDPNGSPINLAAAVVRVYFRAAGASSVLSSILCRPKTDGTDGQVEFDFSNGVLDVPPGSYEGEIEVNFGGLKQTVYEPLKFVVREQFQ